MKKKINGIVNKANVGNIRAIVIELFNENIIYAKGLLARAVLRAQMTAPNFTHVFAALIAVVNSKLPEIGMLVAHRAIAQF